LSPDSYLRVYEKDGKKLHVTAADFSDIMGAVNANMKKAQEFANNDN